LSDWFGTVMLTLLGGSAVVGGARKVIERRRARRALRAPAPLLATSPEGEVLRVTGVVHAGDELIIAPLSGREVVVVRSRVRSGAGFLSRAAKPSETMAMVPFVIVRDDGSKVTIEGDHVELDLPALRMRRSKIDGDRRAKFVAKHGLRRHELARAVFDETIVEVGMRVSVAGLLMKDPIAEVVHEERGFRDDMPTSLRLAGNSDHPLVIGEPVDSAPH
jgi:hypothetical protein